MIPWTMAARVNSIMKAKALAKKRRMMAATLDAPETATMAVKRERIRAPRAEKRKQGR